MYNEKILSQLNELKYLHVIKKSNISVMSKKNSFHDMVKFYAQINKEDVVQKISYKATGCTHFIVFCNHFCTLVEGKKVKDALKVNEQKLEEFVELDESRKHILKIIIDTFALLIKKYRKGVEKGIIEPVEVSEESNNESIVSVKNTQVVEKKINSITKEHKDIEYIKDAKIKIKKEKKSQKAKMIVVDDDITEDVVVNNTQEKVETKKTSKTNKKVEKDNKEKKEVKSTKTKKDEKSENKKSVNKSTVDNREEVKSKENKSDLNSKSKKLKITNESKNSEVVSVVEDKPKALKLIKEDKKVAPKTKKSSQKVQSETKVKSSKNKVSTKSNVNKNEETQEEVEIQKIDDTNLQTENLDQNNEVAIAMTDVEIIEPETEVQPSELQPIQKQTVVVERTEKYY